MNSDSDILSGLRDRSLTVDQAYLCMFEFLRQYYERGPTDEIGGLLGDLSMLPDGGSADPAQLADWANAVSAVLNAEDGDGYNAAKLRLQ